MEQAQLRDELKQIKARLLAEIANIEKIITDLTETENEPQGEAARDQAERETGDVAANIDTHIFMLVLKENYKTAYRAVLNGLREKIIVYRKHEERPFDFLCKSGSVRLMFREAGCTDEKMISKYITVEGREISTSALGNGKSNPEPKEWPDLKIIFFR
jgi:hypothetical protein